MPDSNQPDISQSTTPTEPVAPSPASSPATANQSQPIPAQSTAVPTQPAPTSAANPHVSTTPAQPVAPQTTTNPPQPTAANQPAQAPATPAAPTASSPVAPATPSQPSAPIAPAASSQTTASQPASPVTPAQPATATAAKPNGLPAKPLLIILVCVFHLLVVLVDLYYLAKSVGGIQSGQMLGEPTLVNYFSVIAVGSLFFSALWMVTAVGLWLQKSWGRTILVVTTVLKLLYTIIIGLMFAGQIVIGDRDPSIGTIIRGIFVVIVSAAFIYFLFTNQKVKSIFEK